MTHVTCRLTATNQDQLRNPTLGNRVRATFSLCIRKRMISAENVSLANRVSAVLTFRDRFGTGGIDLTGNSTPQ